MQSDALVDSGRIGTKLRDIQVLSRALLVGRYGETVTHMHVGIGSRTLNRYQEPLNGLFKMHYRISIYFIVLNIFTLQKHKC